MSAATEFWVHARHLRHLFYLRKPNGKPLTFASQARALTPVRGFFKWLTRQNVLLSNPASEIIEYGLDGCGPLRPYR